MRSLPGRRRPGWVRERAGGKGTRATARWSGLVGAVVLVGGLTAGLPAGASSAAGGAPPSAPTTPTPPFAPACGPVVPGQARCGAIVLLDPGVNWHPGPALRGPAAGGGGTSSTPAPPTSGYYPSDLLSAYGLGSAAASFGPGPSAPTIAVVDAYDDPNAASDLAAYRASLSGATDPNTGLADGTIPPLCSSTVTTGCASFTKVNEYGGTSYPRGNTGWAEEISLDLDMASAVCPDCNIVLVEASSATMSNLAQAVAEAESFHPAAVTNSYGGSEFSSETSYNSVYSATSKTAITVATGDSGYGAEFPAASSGVTAVGGTSLAYSGFGSGLTWNPQTVWSGAGSGCSAYEAMPSWQQVSAYSDPSICTDRQIGDIAAVADPSTGVATYDTYRESGWLVFGGTSVSTQIVGAAYGLAAGSGTIDANPSALYTDATAGGTGATPGLVPVASGSNSSCGDYLCNAADSLSSGYNGPAGLGTLDGLGALQGTATSTGALSLSPTAETLTAGTPSGAIAVDASTAPASNLTVSVSTSSPTGEFSTSGTSFSSGSLTVTIAAGSETSNSFYYEDTTAGTPTLTASATGWTSGTMSVSVGPGPLATVTVTPSSATVAEGGTQTFTAIGYDQYGNAVSSISPSWTVSGGLGTFSPSSGPSTTFTAGSTAGSGSVTATQGSVSGSAAIAVTALSAMSVTVTASPATKKGPNYRVPLTVAAADTSTNAALSGASVALDVYSGSSCSGSPVATGSGTTGTGGTATFTFTTRKVATYCAVADVTDAGYSPGTGSTTFTS